MPKIDTPTPQVLPWETGQIFYIDLDPEPQRDQFVDLLEKCLDRLRECRIHHGWLADALKGNNIAWDRRWCDRHWRYDYRRGTTKLSAFEMWFLPWFAGLFGIRVVWVKTIGLAGDRRRVVMSYGPEIDCDIIYNAMIAAWAPAYYKSETYENGVKDELQTGIKNWINALSSK